MPAVPARMRRAIFNTFLAASSFVAAIAHSPTVRAQTISEQEAHDIGVNAYLYFYSPITMDVTRKQLTNMEPGKGHRRSDEYALRMWLPIRRPT